MKLEQLEYKEFQQDFNYELMSSLWDGSQALWQATKQLDFRKHCYETKQSLKQTVKWLMNLYA